MIRSQHIALLSVSLACAGAVLLPAGRAVAQDQAAVDKLVQMNKKALGDYDTLEWDAAKRTLLDALVAGKKELTEEEALAKANEVKKRLEAGEDFAAVAKAESDDGDVNRIAGSPLTAPQHPAREDERRTGGHHGADGCFARAGNKLTASQVFLIGHRNAPG